jgi:hypothetical protein
MFLMPGDASFVQINTNVSSGTVSSYIYTPRSNNSKIIIEYSALYNIGGNTSDDTDAFQSEIKVNSLTDPIGKRQQYFRGGDGTSNRSSTLFPIAGAYNNSALAPIEFKIVLSRISGDDSIQFYGAYFDACMKITEISL